MQTKRTRFLPKALTVELRRLPWRVLGASLVGIAVACWLSLISWSYGDPSPNYATLAQPHNWLGHRGASVADGLDACVRSRLPVPRSCRSPRLASGSQADICRSGPGFGRCIGRRRRLPFRPSSQCFRRRPDGFSMRGLAAWPGTLPPRASPSSRAPFPPNCYGLLSRSCFSRSASGASSGPADFPPRRFLSPSMAGQPWRRRRRHSPGAGGCRQRG